MSRSNRNIPFSMQSEFDSDAYDSDEFGREGNRLHYEEHFDSDRLVIDEVSDYYDQRRQKTPPKARKDSKYQQYIEDSNSDSLMIDEDSEYYDQRRQKTPPKARKDSKYQQYIEDSNSDSLMIDEDSEYYDQRRRKTPEAREYKGNQQYMEGYDNDGLVIDYSSEDESVFERNMANGEQRLTSPPLQEIRQVPGVDHSRRENDDEEEEAMDQNGENAPESPVEVDLMHLAPMHVEETADWPKPVRMSNVRLRHNENFGGDWKEEMRDLNNDCYKSNNHFIWTNQLVVGRGIELDAEENRLCKYLRSITDNPQVPRFPKNIFRLKKAKDFGYGLFAKCFIAKGTVIGEYTGELITNEEASRRNSIYRMHKMSNYFFDTRKPGLTIDAGPMGNQTRFINHSCDDYNCDCYVEIINGTPKNWYVAIKDIPQEHELLVNYGKDYFNNLECLCKGENCVEIEKERRRLEELEEERWMNFKRILRE